jgi:hypothetical protein
MLFSLGEKMKRYSYNIFANYYQFYLQDDDISKGDLSQAWDQTAVDRLLAVGPYVVGIGTARNMPVPVTIEVHEAKPNIDLAEWDRANLCSIGQIVVAGCTDYFPDATRIAIEPGSYKVIVCYKNLDKISKDGIEGEDSYHIFIYPGPEQAVASLK